MTDTSVLDIAVATLLVTAKLSAPILVVSLAVGVGISLLQAMTQVQEVTLTFVPKLGAVALVVAVSGNWMISELISFTDHLFELLPTLLEAA